MTAVGFSSHVVRPLVAENPVTVQILGLCSALAVSTSLRPALIMALCVLGVLLFSNLAVSLLRSVMPRSIRLILEVTLISSAVIVADEALKAFAPDVSEVLTVFVGLIITNCMVLGRAEAFAMSHGPVASAADALGNGFAYGAILLVVACLRELFGQGTLFDYPVVANAAWFEQNELMLYAPSAFFIMGFLVWGIRSLRSDQREASQPPRHLKYEGPG